MFKAQVIVYFSSSQIKFFHYFSESYNTNGKGITKVKKTQVINKYSKLSFILIKLLNMFSISPS